MGVIVNSSLLALVSGERLERLEESLRNGKGRSSIPLRWITHVLRRISTFHHRLLLTTTVTGYLASFLLAALTIAATKHFDKPPGVEWSQAYFFAIFSAGAYFLISCFMLFSAFEAKTLASWRRSLPLRVDVTDTILSARIPWPHCDS